MFVAWTSQIQLVSLGSGELRYKKESSSLMGGAYKDLLLAR